MRRGGDALAGWGRRGRGGGGSVPGLRPCFPLSSTSHPAGLRRAAACPYPEPPSCRRLRPPLAVSPSVPAPCAPPSGPWMGKYSKAQRLCGAAFAPLPFGSRPDAPGPGSRARRRRPEERPRPSPTAGFPGAPNRGGAVRRRLFSPPLVRPRNVRPFTSSHPEAEESRVQPPGAGVRPPRAESGEPGPACRHFLSENGALRWGRRRRRSGRASSPLGSCCLPVRWGERWSFPWPGGEWPRRGGLPVHASGHVWAATWSRSQAPPRSVDVPGDPPRSPDLGSELC